MLSAQSFSPFLHYIWRVLTLTSLYLIIIFCVTFVTFEVVFAQKICKCRCKLDRMITQNILRFHNFYVLKDSTFRTSICAYLYTGVNIPLKQKRERERISTCGWECGRETRRLDASGPSWRYCASSLFGTGQLQVVSLATWFRVTVRPPISSHHQILKGLYSLHPF